MEPYRDVRLPSTREKEVVPVEGQYQDGAITHGERYNKIIEIWSRVTEKVSDSVLTRESKRGVCVACYGQPGVWWNAAKRSV